MQTGDYACLACGTTFTYDEMDALRRKREKKKRKGSHWSAASRRRVGRQGWGDSEVDASEVNGSWRRRCG